MLHLLTTVNLLCLILYMCLTCLPCQWHSGRVVACPEPCSSGSICAVIIVNYLDSPHHCLKSPQHPKAKGRIKLYTHATFLSGKIAGRAYLTRLLHWILWIYCNSETHDFSGHFGISEISGYLKVSISWLKAQSLEIDHLGLDPSSTTYRPICVTWDTLLNRSGDDNNSSYFMGLLYTSLLHTSFSLYQALNSKRYKYSLLLSILLKAMYIFISF